MAASDPDDPLAPLRRRLDGALELLSETLMRTHYTSSLYARRRANQVNHHLNVARVALEKARELVRRQ
jgi:hypothetical protein